MTSGYRNSTIQRFPGDKLPTTSMREYPNPNAVCRYMSWKEFQKVSKCQSQWVHWKQRTEQIINGDYFEIKPVHFEGIFTLACNFMCPHCTRRAARNRWVASSTWENNSAINDDNTLSLQGIRRVLDEVVKLKTDNQMGIVWGGGDPTLIPHIYDALSYAKSIGISSSFITNGALMDVDRLISINPTLIRISLNCGSERQYVKFHGYPKKLDYFNRTVRNITDFVKSKSEAGCTSLFGISLIADERNIGDLDNALSLITDITREHGSGIDYIIIRPTMNYKHFEGNYVSNKAETKNRILERIGRLQRIVELREKYDIPLIQIKDSFMQPPSDEFYSEGTDCLAYGMCGEIRHNGDVQLCSDSYGDPRYTIGNLHSQSIEEIWTGNRRMNVLKWVNDTQCYKNRCPHNSRGHHMNREFHQIDALRKRGDISAAMKWAEDLRLATYPPGHSFFI